jgi:hypothetical protein
LSIVSWVGATFATLYGFPLVQPYARAVIPIELLADVIAGVVIFIVVLVVLSIATRVVANFIQESSLGPLDRSLGLVFGLLRGFVIACLPRSARSLARAGLRPSARFRDRLPGLAGLRLAAAARRLAGLGPRGETGRAGSKRREPAPLSSGGPKCWRRWPRKI